MLHIGGIQKKHERRVISDCCLDKVESALLSCRSYTPNTLELAAKLEKNKKMKLVIAACVTFRLQMFLSL